MNQYEATLSIASRGIRDDHRCQKGQGTAQRALNKTRDPPHKELRDKLHCAGCEVVHRACDFDVSLLLQVFENGTAAADFGHR